MMNSDVNKKTIAFYIGSLCIGGAERVICNLAEYFYSQNYEVYMVTKLKDDVEYELSDGITRIIADITKEEETGSRLGNLLARIIKLRSIWQDINPDIIVSFIKKNNLMAIASASPLKIPVVVSVRSAPKRELSGRGVKELTYLLFRKAAGIVLQTTEALEFFPGFIQKSAIILPNSINPEFLREIDELHSDTNTPRQKQIIAVGRIDNNKNQKMLVECFAKIADLYPEWSVELYGDGAGRKSLQDYVKQNGLSDRVHFHGAVSDIPVRMKQASIFVLPSRIEGMPNALIEAMVMGLACISTNCVGGGPRDLINSEEENGILIPVDDYKALTDALVRLMESEDDRVKMGNNAKRIIDRLHPDIVNNRWKEYVDGIISNE